MWTWRDWGSSDFLVCVRGNSEFKKEGAESQPKPWASYRQASIQTKQDESPKRDQSSVTWTKWPGKPS